MKTKRIVSLCDGIFAIVSRLKAIYFHLDCHRNRRSGPVHGDQKAIEAEQVVLPLIVSWPQRPR